MHTLEAQQSRLLESSFIRLNNPHNDLLLENEIVAHYKSEKEMSVNDLINRLAESEHKRNDQAVKITLL